MFNPEKLSIILTQWVSKKLFKKCIVFDNRCACRCNNYKIIEQEHCIFFPACL